MPPFLLIPIQNDLLWQCFNGKMVWDAAAKKGYKMKKISILCFLIVFLISSPAVIARLSVKCDIEKIAQHELLVTLSWKVSVYSDKDWDACDLIISFKDSQGHKIHTLSERLRLKAGPNSFTGHEICDTKIWKRTERYVATLDCVF